jgi:hypothetical protein
MSRITYLNFSSAFFHYWAGVSTPNRLSVGGCAQYRPVVIATRSYNAICHPKILKVLGVRAEPQQKSISEVWYKNQQHLNHSLNYKAFNRNQQFIF